ncbi:hypothetical protein TNCV_2128291 [Trichonephila clavipes]|nr:hypothetical protein TNCV_2128291 [Trichonephila clavipes]
MMNFVGLDLAFTDQVALVTTTEKGCVEEVPIVASAILHHITADRFHEHVAELQTLGKFKAIGQNRLNVMYCG